MSVKICGVERERVKSTGKFVLAWQNVETFEIYRCEKCEYGSIT